MANKPKKHIPPLRFNWLTPIYDPFIRFTMRENVFKPVLLEETGIAEGMRVLDVGCGTATLVLMIKRAYPGADVVGIDPDEGILKTARIKVRESGLSIALDKGSAVSLPYADASFDRVVSSLVFHHLTSAEKRTAAREIFRVLRPGGLFLLADFGRPHTSLMRIISLATYYLEEAADNISGRLPELLREAGFSDVHETRSFGSLFGTVTFVAAKKR